MFKVSLAHDEFEYGEYCFHSSRKMVSLINGEYTVAALCFCVLVVFMMMCSMHCLNKFIYEKRLKFTFDLLIELTLYTAHIGLKYNLCTAYCKC